MLLIFSMFDLSNYMRKLNRKSRRLRKRGQDLYVATFFSIKKIISLPYIDRMSKKDSSLKITYNDIEYLKNFFPNVNTKNCLDINVFPYSYFDYSNLEDKLKIEI